MQAGRGGCWNTYLFKTLKSTGESVVFLPEPTFLFGMVLIGRDFEAEISLCND
jgi:hypothetical protein